MFEWLKVSEFWYGTIAGGMFTLGVRYLLLLRKEDGEKRRDQKQHERIVEERARQEWNEAIKPIRKKIVAVTLHDAYELIELDDYNELAELIEARSDEQAAAQFIMECRGYNDYISDKAPGAIASVDRLRIASGSILGDEILQGYAERIMDYVKPIK